MEPRENEGLNGGFHSPWLTKERNFPFSAPVLFSPPPVCVHLFSPNDKHH